MAVVATLSKGYDLEYIWAQVDRGPVKDAASAGSGSGDLVAARIAAATETGRPAPGLTERLAYPIDEAALLTGLSRDLLYDQMRHGNLTYVKIGHRRLITRHHLQQFLGDAPT